MQLARAAGQLGDSVKGEGVPRGWGLGSRVWGAWLEGLSRQVGEKPASHLGRAVRTLKKRRKSGPKNYGRRGEPLPIQRSPRIEYVGPHIMRNFGAVGTSMPWARWSSRVRIRANLQFSGPSGLMRGSKCYIIRNSRLKSEGIASDRQDRFGTKPFDRNGCEDG